MSRDENLILKQDFIDWLAADEKGREISDDVGLLVVPVENEQPPESVPDVQEPTPQEANENNFFVENLSDLSSEILELNETVKQLQTSLADPPAVNQINDTEIKIDLDDDTDIHKAWQETAADLNLSLDEPPPELWTRINEYDEDYDDDEIEYEQGMSLQGAAYVQKREHGKNFTERLHYTLKGRKQKAEALRKEEEERKKTRHPYFSRAVIFCTTMLMVIGVAFAALWFVSEWLPEKLRVKHEEPTPVVSEELESGRSEEAGASIVRGEELGVRSEEDTSSNDIIISEDVPPVIEPPKEEEIDIKIPVTFEDFLTEANDAYNLGMYNMAVINFFKAININNTDVRAYIGLAGAYRAKGMYFDSKRILDEAVRRFKRNATVETMLQILRED